jgi:hypothetical protein
MVQPQQTAKKNRSKRPKRIAANSQKQPQQTTQKNRSNQMHTSMSNKIVLIKLPNSNKIH